MSDQPAPPEPVLPSSPSPSSTAAGGRRTPPRPASAVSSRGVLAPLALIVALLALAGVVLGGWQWWQWRQHRQADTQTMTALQQRVATLASTAQQDAANHQQQEQTAQAASAALGQRLTGLTERVGGLENAVAGLARHSQQGRRAMLLDQAELLLRMGLERYALFHDAAGALKADSLAGQALAAVDDPAYAGVRQTLAAERAALAALHPAIRAADLATLAQLRSTIVQLPLKPLDANAGKAPSGVWQRIWQALSTAVVIRRVNGSPQSLADAQLTRQLAALDVAQAEAARLAWDEPSFHAALKRVQQALATAFDARNADVRKAQATVQQLLAEPAGQTPSGLGDALRQLRNLRAVQAASSSSDTPPATPSSTAPPAAAGHSA